MNRPTMRLRASAKLAALALLILPLSACAPASTSSASQQTADVELLQQSERQDIANANKPQIGPVAQEDFYAQAGRADTAAKELEHGFPVSQARIDRAVIVPAEPLTAEQRSQLIQKLEAAKVLADRGSTDHDDNPILTEDFIQQGKQIDRVIRQLEIGNEVHNSDIQQALESPGMP
jgi:hypothetical protein